MCALRYLLTGFFLCLLVRASDARGDLSISQWRLHSQVSCDNTDTVRFLTVQNPFADQHTAQCGNSFVTTSYDISWLLDSASLDISTDQHMAQLDGGVTAGGQVYFTPMVNSLMTLSSRYDYNWPNSVIGESAIGFIVGDITDDIRVFDETRHGGNVGLGPPHGTLEVSGVIPLLAGHDYAFSYSMGTDQDDPSPPGTFGTADGHIHWDISIPEPASLFPLALSALLLSRRHLRSPEASRTFSLD